MREDLGDALGGDTALLPASTELMKADMPVLALPIDACEASVTHSIDWPVQCAAAFKSSHARRF